MDSVQAVVLSKIILRWFYLKQKSEHNSVIIKSHNNTKPIIAAMKLNTGIKIGIRLYKKQTALIITGINTIIPTNKAGLTIMHNIIIIPFN